MFNIDLEGQQLLEAIRAVVGNTKYTYKGFVCFHEPHLDTIVFRVALEYAGKSYTVQTAIIYTALDGVLFIDTLICEQIYKDIIELDPLKDWRLV